ncbi:MAG: prolipoprotein diacylglyceryl transferase [Oscillospiraceae bacterium]|nr:prolipoprotein diacylglyceryl transferase [Oscillospiraceae bacterium]
MNPINNYIEFPNLGLNFNIERTISVFGFNIYWYGIIVTAAIILGVLYAMTRARQFGMITDRVFDAAAAGIIGGFIGARLYYVIFYNLNPENEVKFTPVTAITGIRDGGLAIYGGVIGAVVFGLVFMKLRKIKLTPVLDLAGLGFLMGIGIGRWGNFFNQEAYGAVIKTDNLPWGMTGSRIARDVGEGALVHPCFLYESLWCLLGFVLLHFYSKKLRTFDGEIFLLFAAWYGTGRAFNEQLRADSLMLGYFKVSQLLAIITAIISIAGFIYCKRRTANNPDYKMYCNTEESAKLIAAHEENIILQKEKAEAKKALRKQEETAPSILADDNERDAEI